MIYEVEVHTLKKTNAVYEYNNIKYLQFNCIVEIVMSLKYWLLVQEFTSRLQLKYIYVVFDLIIEFDF